jgi:hypothetical protein
MLCKYNYTERSPVIQPQSISERCLNVQAGRSGSHFCHEAFDVIVIVQRAVKLPVSENDSSHIHIRTDILLTRTSSCDSQDEFS